MIYLSQDQHVGAYLLYFGLALMVNNGLSRALVSFFMGFTKPPVPTQSFDTIENGIEWLKTVRSQ